VSRKANGAATGESFIKLPRDLVRSDAWRSASINARRFIDFLMLEHMGKGGRENGKLKAPYRQLQAFGIAARFISGAISEAERLGLVECHRGGMRVATTYSLQWLDANGATDAAGPNPWRAFCNADLVPLSTPKIKNLHHKGNAALPYKGNADGEICPTKGMQIGPKPPENLPYKGNALSREVSYQGGEDISDLSVVLAAGVHVDAAGAIWRATHAEWLPVQGRRLRVVRGARS
jgi:hypothetical protein